MGDGRGHLGVVILNFASLNEIGANMSDAACPPQAEAPTLYFELVRDAAQATKHSAA